MLKELSKESFDNEINGTKPVMVDFWASWCGPCRMVSPIIDALAEEFGEKISVCKVNIDEEGELAERFSVSSIPTVAFFKNGEVVKKLIGVQSEDEYVSAITEVL